MRGTLTAVCAIGAVAAATNAEAQLGISARTSGLGGAGTALARGGEGIFYNPALMPRTPHTEIGLSANAYGYSKQTFSNFFEIVGPQGGSEGADLESANVIANPSAASTIYPFELFGLRQAFGLGVFSPYSGDVEAEVLFDPESDPSSRSLFFESSATEYWLSAAYGVDLGPLSLGLTAIGQIGTFEDRSGFTALEPGPSPTSPQFSTVASRIKGNTVDLRAALGAAFTLGGFTAGATFTSPSLNVYGNVQWSNTESEAGPSGNFMSTFSLDNGTATAGSAPELRVGLGYDLEWLAIGLDANLFLPWTSKRITFEAFEAEGIMYTDDAFEASLPFTFSLSAGAEVWISEVAIRAGAFVVFDNAPALLSDTEIDGLNQRLAAREADIVDAFAEEGEKVMEVGGSLGFAFMQGSARTDVGLTFILIRGEHVRTGSQLDDFGDPTPHLGKHDIRGWAVIASLGGTYGFEGDDDEAK